MSYIRAEEILPKELIEAIQEYTDGTCIYIPCRTKQKWGSRTETRKYYEKRNREICEKHQNGSRVSELAEEYALSEKSIQRILRCTAEDGKNTD